MYSMWSLVRGSPRCPWSASFPKMIKYFVKKKNTLNNERYRDLLISILSYDEVSAFLLRVKTWNWKSRFRVETITFLRFYRAAYLRRGPRTRFADQGPSKTVAFLRIPSKIFMSGTWNFRIIDRNIKAIFREYFSSLHEDSGKIFKIMTFTRGPRTTYCTVFVFQEWGDTINQDLLKNKSYLKRDTIGQRAGMSLKNYGKL